MDILNRPVSAAEREAQWKKYQKYNDQRLRNERAESAMDANMLLDRKAANQPITDKDRAVAQYGWERNMHLRQAHGSGAPYVVRSNSYKDMRAELGDTAWSKTASGDSHDRMAAWLRDRRATEAMRANRVNDMRSEGLPVTNDDRMAAQQGWEQNMFLRNLQDAYDKNYSNYAGNIFRNKAGHNEVVEKSFKDAREAYNEKMYGKDRIGAFGKARSVMSPGAAAPYTEYTTDSAGARTAELGDYGNVKQAAEGTVPSAEASMPAHEESHDTHGNEVNPFEKVVKAYNAYKAKKGFKEETPTVTPNVTGNLPPAPGNLVHEWYAKEHGMERMASVMEKQAISWNGAKHWFGKWWGNMGDLYDKVTEGKWEEVPDAVWNATPIAVGLEAAEKQLTDFTSRQGGHLIDAASEKLQSPEVQKKLDEQYARAGRTAANSAMDAVWDRGKKLINGNHIGNLFGLGGENWKWGLGALGLAGAGYGLYKLFSGGGGSGGGWGGGAANSSAYYRNRHGYNRPDYEGMMVDNMMARRGGYGY